jgi:hypothetical protein
MDIDPPFKTVATHMDSDPARKIALLALNGDPSRQTEMLEAVFHYAFEQLCWYHTTGKLETLLSDLQNGLGE